MEQDFTERQDILTGSVQERVPGQEGGTAGQRQLGAGAREIPGPVQNN